MLGEGARAIALAEATCGEARPIGVAEATWPAGGSCGVAVATVHRAPAVERRAGEGDAVGVVSLRLRLGGWGWGYNKSQAICQKKTNQAPERNAVCITSNGRLLLCLRSSMPSPRAMACAWF